MCSSILKLNENMYFYSGIKWEKYTSIRKFNKKYVVLFCSPMRITKSNKKCENELSRTCRYSWNN